ncbi:MAG: hypothetical protein ACTSRQ_13725 [Candidatus Thorarchaeota archaeon]
MTEKNIKRLKDLLENGKDWEKIKTTTLGVFVVRSKETKSRGPQLLVEVNPPDAAGNPTKWKGLKIWNRSELEAFREIISSPKLDDIFDILEQICPETKETILDL